MKYYLVHSKKANAKDSVIEISKEVAYKEIAGAIEAELMHATDDDGPFDYDRAVEMAIEGFEKSNFFGISKSAIVKADSKPKPSKELYSWDASILYDAVERKDKKTKKSDEVLFSLKFDFLDDTGKTMSFTTPAKEDFHLEADAKKLLECKSYEAFETVIVEGIGDKRQVDRSRYHGFNESKLDQIIQRESEKIERHREAFLSGWNELKRTLEPFEQIRRVTLARVLESDKDLFITWSAVDYPDLKPLAKKAAGKTAKADEAAKVFEKYIKKLKVSFPGSDVNTHWPTNFCLSNLLEAKFVWKQISNDVKVIARMITDKTFPKHDYCEEVVVIDYEKHKIQKHANVIPGGTDGYEKCNY